MCLVDLLCGLGFGVTGVFCYRLHCSEPKNTKRVFPYVQDEDDCPRKLTSYELEIHSRHMQLYGS
jgi:hypothetical protein